jgi:F-type H+-transporting ATPase subunit alpha
MEDVKARVAEKMPVRPKAFNAEYVISELQAASERQKHSSFIRSVGTVQHVGNGIATLSGLPMVFLEELVTFPNGVQGMVLNLDRKHVDVILLGDDTGIRGGDVAKATGKRLSIPVGLSFLGRMVDPLGRPLDENRTIVLLNIALWNALHGCDRSRASGYPIVHRTKIIDALLPLGRGQRELIVGDRQVGKTTWHWMPSSAKRALTSAVCTFR